MAKASTYDTYFANKPYSQILNTKKYADLMKKGSTTGYWDSYRKCLGDSVKKDLPSHDFHHVGETQNGLRHFHDRLMVAYDDKGIVGRLNQIFRGGDSYKIVVDGGEYGCRYIYDIKKKKWVHRTHHGIDISAAEGARLYGIGFLGKISKIWYNGVGPGNTVWVTYGVDTVGYMHMKSIYVKEGDMVFPTTCLGTVGKTGGSYDPHLHLEIRKGTYDGETLGPRTWANDMLMGTVTIGDTGSGGGTSGGSGNWTISKPNFPPKTGSVSSVQTLLNSKYNFSLAISGVVTTELRGATVHAVQRELNSQWGAQLVVDGIFGPASKAAWKYGVKYGDSGNITKLIQAKLITVGYDSLALDGVFGQNTGNAVASFQKSQGLFADGIVGAMTATSLFGGGNGNNENINTGGDDLMIMSTHPIAMKIGPMSGGDMSALRNLVTSLGIYCTEADGHLETIAVSRGDQNAILQKAYSLGIGFGPLYSYPIYMSTRSIAMKIGPMSGGDMNTFKNLLTSLGISFTEKNGYLETVSITKGDHNTIMQRAVDFSVGMQPLVTEIYTGISQAQYDDVVADRNVINIKVDNAKSILVEYI